MNKQHFTPVVLFLSVLGLAACNKQDKTQPAAKEEPTAKTVEATPAPKSFAAVSASKNEWNSSASLSQFKEKLNHDLDAGDQEAILSNISNILEFNSGTAKGKAGVVEIFGLDGTPEKLKPLQSLLKTLISNGGCLGMADKDSTFTAPSYNCISKDEQCGEAGCGMAVAEGATLRKAPSADAEQSGKLLGGEIIPSYRDTICDEHFTACKWTLVTRKDGSSGFVEKGKVQIESDGMLWLVKESVGWKIRVLKGPGVAVDET